MQNMHVYPLTEHYQKPTIINYFNDVLPVEILKLKYIYYAIKFDLIPTQSKKKLINMN